MAPSPTPLSFFSLSTSPRSPGPTRCIVMQCMRAHNPLIWSFHARNLRTLFRGHQSAVCVSERRCRRSRVPRRYALASATPAPSTPRVLGSCDGQSIPSPPSKHSSACPPAVQGHRPFHTFVLAPHLKSPHVTVAAVPILHRHEPPPPRPPSPTVPRDRVRLALRIRRSGVDFPGGRSSRTECLVRHGPDGHLAAGERGEATAGRECGRRAK